jgi:sulfite exporter TauE/SafE
MVLHVAGSTAGGVLLFGSLGVIGHLSLGGVPLAVRWAGAGVLSLVFGLNEFGLLRLPLPRNHHSVPQSWWFDLGPNQAALVYGFVLGLGVTTVVPFGTFYAVGAWALLAAGPGYGAALGAAYGLARALPVLGVSLVMVSHRRRATAFDTGSELALRIADSRRAAHVISGLADAAFAGAAVATLVLTP